MHLTERFSQRYHSYNFSEAHTPLFSSAELKNIEQQALTPQPKVTQLIVLCTGFVLMLFACLMPPWQEEITLQPAGYAWVWFSPYQKELRLRQAEASERQHLAVASAEAKVVSTKKEYARIRNSPCELARQRTGGFSLDDAVYRECAAKAAFARALSERKAVSDKSLDWWMEQPLKVEVNLAMLINELAVIASVTIIVSCLLQRR
jgi:hypothetical protein